MRLIEEIFKSADGEFPARYTVVVGGGGYFEGVKAVGDFFPNKIVLYYPHETVEVEGENLSIQKYLDNDLQIGGKISSVKRLCPPKKEE